ncbi:MAG: NYN domain-containing protein [Candidatus Saccharimonadales bacterium]
MATAKKPRVFAFIDSQNLNVSVQKFGWKMDWRKFRQFLEKQYGVSQAYMFIGYLPENENLYEQMHAYGYMVVLKPTFDLTRPQPDMMTPAEAAQFAKNNPAEDKKPVKGNIDAELVLWAMKEISNYDQAVIVSGDGDFYCLVEYLAGKNRLKALLAPNAHYSSLYNAYEKYVVRLDSFRSQLAYHDRFPRKRNKSGSDSGRKAPPKN